MLTRIKVKTKVYQKYSDNTKEYMIQIEFFDKSNARKALIRNMDKLDQVNKGDYEKVFDKSEVVDFNTLAICFILCLLYDRICHSRCI